MFGEPKHAGHEWMAVTVPAATLDIATTEHRLEHFSTINCKVWNSIGRDVCHRDWEEDDPVAMGHRLSLLEISGNYFDGTDFSCKNLALNSSLLV